MSCVKAGCSPLLCWPWPDCSVILNALCGPSACSSGPSVCLQTCHEGEDPGEVVIRLRKQDILKVHTSLTWCCTNLQNFAFHKLCMMICLLRVICSLLACRCPDWGRSLWTQEAQRQ